MRKIISLLLLITCCSMGAFAQKSKKDKKAEALAQKKEAFEQNLINAHRELMMGNNDRAFDLFEKCTRIDEDAAVPYFKLAELSLARRQVEQAHKYSKKACKLDPANKWYLQQKARIEMELKKYDDAAETYQDILKLDPQDQSMYMETAAMYTLAGKTDQAIKIYDKLEKEIGLNEQVIMQKERLYLSTNKFSKAAEEVQKLVDAFPGEMRYLGMLAELYDANGQTDKAFNIYQQILEKEPNNGSAHFALSDYYRNKGDKVKYFDEMKKGFADKNFDIKAKLAVLVRYFGVMRTNSELKEEAFSLARILVETNPADAAAHTVYGDMLANDKQYKEAIEQYRTTLDIEQDKYNVWQQLIFCRAELYDYDHMAEDCTKALELFPNMPELYYYAAIAKRQQKKNSEVITLCRQGLELGIADVNMQIQLLSNMGDAAYFTREYNLSDSAFEEALKLDADNDYVLNNYAYFLSVRKVKLEKAERMSRKTLDKNPGSSTYQDTYGWILYQLKHYDEALPLIRTAAEKETNSAEVQEHYGDALYRKGQVDEAVKQWQKAKELGSENMQQLEKKIREKKIAD